jgi:kojibiose phosphorylase
VVGPDEFHEHVDNTPTPTTWCGGTCSSGPATPSSRQPSASWPSWPSASAYRDEVRDGGDWPSGCPAADHGRGVIEQFDGYFELRDLPVELDENDMPQYPHGYHHYNLEGRTAQAGRRRDADLRAARRLRRRRQARQLRLLRAADAAQVVDQPGVHSIMGIEVGDPVGRSSTSRGRFVDLIDNQGNAGEGIHIASAGGTWQMMVSGFGGFRVRNGRMTFKPWLPPDWDGHLLPARLARQHGRGADPAGLRDVRADRPGRRQEQIVVNGGSARCRPVNRSWSSWTGVAV